MADDQVKVTITAETQQLQDQMARAEQALKALNDAVTGTRDGLNSLNPATAEVIRKYDSAAGTLDRAQAAFQHVSEALENNELSATQAGRMMDQIAANAEKATPAMDAVGRSTVGTRREIMVLGHEIISGNFSRIPGSLMVLVERTGGVGAAFGMLANPVALAGAAVAGVAAVFASMVIQAESNDRALNQLQDSVAATGQSAMANRTQLAALIAQMAALPGVSRETATEIINDFARTRGVSQDTFEELTRHIDRYALVLGTTAPVAA
jgi:uncharacterized coiled-coil protein SlyX